MGVVHCFCFGVLGFHDNNWTNMDSLTLRKIETAILENDEVINLCSDSKYCNHRVGRCTGISHACVSDNSGSKGNR